MHVSETVRVHYTLQQKFNRTTKEQLRGRLQSIQNPRVRFHSTPTPLSLSACLISTPARPCGDKIFSPAAELWAFCPDQEAPDNRGFVCPEALKHATSDPGRGKEATHHRADIHRSNVQTVSAVSSVGSAQTAETVETCFACSGW